VIKHFAGALIACALILFDCRNSTAADNKATRVAYPSAAASFIPLWAANDAGFFKKDNLAVELVSIRSSPIAMTALLSGEIDVVVGGANPSVSMQLRGYKDVALFGGLFNTFLFSICAVPSIEDLSQLKGKRLGVTRFGGSNDFCRALLSAPTRFGPQKDLTLIQVGSQDDLLRALLAKNLDAAVMGYPAVLIAKKTACARSPNRSISCERGRNKEWQLPSAICASAMTIFSKRFTICTSSCCPNCPRSSRKILSWCSRKSP
jgi:ABC-type nitrate/sulfonate/bicarbonate transport system substrate-binding protein